MAALQIRRRENEIEEAQVFHSNIDVSLEQGTGEMEEEDYLEENLDDIEAPSQTSSRPKGSTSTDKKRRHKKHGKHTKAQPKPDLRKRTWDKVEKGLDSLEYD